MYVYRHRHGHHQNIVIYRSAKTAEAEDVCNALEAAGLFYLRRSEPNDSPLTTIASFPAFHQAEVLLVPAADSERAREVLQGFPGLLPAPIPEPPKPVRWYDRPLSPAGIVAVLSIIAIALVASLFFFATHLG